MNKIVIALDGPAGSGKTTIAKALSKKLNIMYLNTGALYRALAYKCIKNGLDATSTEVAEQIAKNTDLKVEYKDGLQHVFVDGEDVTDKLSSDEVSIASSQISVHKEIRHKMVELQRHIADKQSIIVDGRDIGSVVLPKADFKFYLDADVGVRAERRYKELVSKGSGISFEEVLKDMKERDHRDMTRDVSPLKKCADAIVIDCTNLGIDEVIEKFMEYIGRR
ncbi:MAG TPA: (d)CMP kinase [Clostridiales bacterium]|nr:(d)CMP kinase [Clostridiales bacterium]